MDNEPPRRRRVKKRRVQAPVAPVPKPARFRPEGRSDVPALVVFIMLVAAAPLAFGAVDQLIQAALLVIFAVGLALKPPAVLALPPRAVKLVLAVLALLVLKEFAPAAIFGGTSWRTTLTLDYGLTFPWTHHPEPGRALDVLLAGLVAVLWFLWVRTLGARRENRAVLAWGMFAAAVLVAGVSFATKGLDSQAIYGLRYTPGWRGFGPFPNRNHTACFLAIGTIISFGCLAWAGTRRKWIVVAGAGVLALLPLAALLSTQSRGGLLAFAVGCAVYVALMLWKYRSKRAVAGVVTAAFVVVALALAFGGPLLARFSSPESDVSNLTRVQLWRDAFFMWRDAPLLGHGAGSFPSIFPMYLRVQLDNQQVLHPESSWLLWLAELGLLPLVLICAGLVWFMAPHVRELLARRQGYSLAAACFAGGVVLLAHCAIDVPGHRWGTVGFALAAFAVALPPLRSSAGLDAPVLPAGSARTALIPLAVAALWAAPVMMEWPRWSPLTAGLLVQKANETASVTTEELDAELAVFPLNGSLHHLRGFYELQRERPNDQIWLRHFRTAQRLMPSAWPLAIREARACLAHAPIVAIGFWQQAIERSGMRRFEILGLALEETGRVPGARDAWASYVKANPPMALTFARTLPVAEAREYYQLWWQTRAAVRGIALEEPELRTFYEMAPQWATPAEFEEWMRLHADRGIKDFREWARVLHAWQQDEAAWRLLARRLPEMPWPSEPISVAREQLEQRWRRLPGNMINAQNLATAHFRAGDLASAMRVILATAERPDSPAWFTRKAAYLLAGEGKLGQAVEILLKEKPPAAEAEPR